MRLLVVLHCILGASALVAKPSVSCVALVGPRGTRARTKNGSRSATRRLAIRKEDELPRVQPGEVDWDDEYRKMMAKKSSAPPIDPKEVSLQLDRARARATNVARSTASNISAAAQSKDQRGFQFWVSVLIGVSVVPILIAVFSTPEVPEVASMYI